MATTKALVAFSLALILAPVSIVATISSCSSGCSTLAEVKTGAVAVAQCSQPAIASVTSELAPLVTQLIQRALDDAGGSADRVDLGPLMAALSGLRSEVERCVVDVAFAILTRKPAPTQALAESMMATRATDDRDQTMALYRRLVVVRYGGAAHVTSSAPD